MANLIFPTWFDEKTTIAQDDMILMADSEDSNKIKKAKYSNLKWEKGDTGTAATITVGSTTTWAAWTSASVTNSWTSSAAVLDFTIPKWDKGDTGDTGAAWADWKDWKDGTDGQDWASIVSWAFSGDDLVFTKDDWNTVTITDAKIDLKWDTWNTWAAATIAVGTVTTWAAWSSATVTNSGTSAAAVFDFSIPQWDKWDTWATWNWIASITSSKSWKITTVTITETWWNVDTFQVSDWADWQWAWDVVWPNSSTDGHLAVFDWATWKLIKDWWSVPTWFNPWTWTTWQVLKKTNDWYWWANESWAVTSVNWQTWAVTLTIPSDTGDLTNGAWYITWIDSGDVTTALWYTPANSANLWTAAACNTWTSSWNVPVLDSNWKLNTNTLPWVALTDTFTVSTSADLVTLSSADQWDIAIVTSESKTYVLSQAPYSTAANWKELLSPTDAVTSVNSKTWAVTLDADDISDSTTTNKFVTATDKSTWSGKQDALTLPSTPTSWHLVTWWWSNKTFADWWAIPTWVPAVWTNWQVLTVVSWAAAWANAPATWIQNDTTWTTTTVTKIWAGTEAEYNALSTHSANIIYHIY